ncbi:nucleolar protein 12 [Cornus florida]|uniref:nucleolar protein 12 n=1 Tax=Cornus florida TaxID=4283 RepID=UPI0028A2C3C6|nr:nucleolar protein 12 [Cornus florida]
MAKKPKNPDNKEKANGDSSSGSASGSSNIFKTLFGDVPEQGTSGSIFSDDNPFRRKANGSVGDVDNPSSADSENPNFVEVKKRKRSKEKKPNLDSGSADEAPVSPSEIKKSRRDKPREEGERPDLGFDLKESSKKSKGENPNLELESKELLEKGKSKARGVNSEIEVKDEEKGKEMKKQKKRKRDELEEKYEVKRYGVVAEKDEGGGGGLGGRLVGEKRKTVDNPEDMLVSKEDFDDEDKLLRTVFVGNLPLKVKKKALLKEFSQFGEVESVRIRSIPIIDSKVPRKGAIIKKQINDSIDSVHAYIVFKTEQSAQASLDHNMAVVGGNHIRVDRACPPRKKLKGEQPLLYDNKRTVFVGNLPFDVKDEELYQLFSGIKDLESSIEAIRVIRDPNTCVGKGIAYVLFKTRDAANVVIKKRNLKLRDRDLRLSRAQSNATPSKRKSPSSAETNHSPAKKFAADSRTPNSNNKVKTKASISYQGVRASKSGVQKKVSTKIAEPSKLKSRIQKGDLPKERKIKRPSVAARKANVLKGGGGGASKEAGKKRKLGSQTPESARPNKKARKFR